MLLAHPIEPLDSLVRLASNEYGEMIQAVYVALPDIESSMLDECIDWCLHCIYCKHIGIAAGKEPFIVDSVTTAEMGVVNEYCLHFYYDDSDISEYIKKEWSSFEECGYRFNRYGKHYTILEVDVDLPDLTPNNRTI